MEKKTIFRLFELLVFIAQKHVFSLKNIVKHIFLAYVAQKKEDGKMANFPPKPRTNPFGIMTIFRFFELLVFIAQKHVFSFSNIVKHIFLAYITFKKNMEKWSIFDQNHRLTPWEKWQLFHFLNFLFLQLRKTFYCSRIS